MTTLRVLAGSALAVLALASCTTPAPGSPVTPGSPVAPGSSPAPGSLASSPGGSAEPRVDVVATLLDSAGLRLPVQDYLPTPEQEDRISAARVTLVRRCLARYGVDYPMPAQSSSDRGPRSLTDRRYGITDVALARTAGYGLGARDPVNVERPAKPDIGVDGETALSGQGRSLVRGQPVPAGGCLGTAEATVNRAVPAGADVRRGSQLLQTSFESSKQDSRVVATFAAWSGCMAKAGYHYADPLRAAGDPAFSRAAQPSAQQLAVAAADIACKASTNLVGVWFTVECAYQRRAIDADIAGFTATRQAIEAVDRTVTSIVRGN